MQYIIFDNMEICSEQEVARLLEVVSEQRRQQALSYKHLFGQFCCLKSYEILLELLDARCSRDSRHSRGTSDVRPIFVYNEYGQPRIEGGPYFSISHCKKAIAVAVSDSPIGIDIESIRVVQPSLMDKTMNDAEKAGIVASEDSNMAFTNFWTQKEAYLKMQGTGIIADLKTTLMEVDPSKVVIETQEYPAKGYVMSLAHTAID